MKNELQNAWFQFIYKMTSDEIHDYFIGGCDRMYFMDGVLALQTGERCAAD